MSDVGLTRVLHLLGVGGHGGEAGGGEEERDDGEEDGESVGRETGGEDVQGRELVRLERYFKASAPYASAGARVEARHRPVRLVSHPPDKTYPT